jgi:hypothetical protein
MRIIMVGSLVTVHEYIVKLFYTHLSTGTSSWLCGRRMHLAAAKLTFKMWSEYECIILKAVQHKHPASPEVRHLDTPTEPEMQVPEHA